MIAPYYTHTKTQSGGGTTVYNISLLYIYIIYATVQITFESIAVATVSFSVCNH
jgi:hypothetical protein